MSSFVDHQQDMPVGCVRLRVSVSHPVPGLATASQPPLLLIMGLGGHLPMWQPLRVELHRLGVTTIAFDNPGTGDSTRYRFPRRAAGVVRTIEDLLAALEIDRVDVLGVSLGGGLAQQLAHQAPTVVRRLVLAATSTGSISMPPSTRALRVLASPRRYYDRAYYQRVAASAFGGKAGRPAEDGTAALRFARPPSLLGYLHQLYATAGWTSLPWLHTLRQPTLILTGDDDPVIPVVNGRILAHLIPDSRLVILPGAGHLFLADEAKTVAPVIADFLAVPHHRDHPRGGSAGAHPR
jgi:poly(3-hydroxyalkanoate) depolymerase